MRFLLRVLLPVMAGVIGLLAVAEARADRASSRYHQAMAYKKKGELTKAIAALRQAIDERPDYAAAHRSLGILYRRQQQLPLAIRHLERAVALQPRSGDTHYSLALAYHAAGRKPEALRALRKAAQLKPDDARIAAQLGTLLIRSEPEQALPYLQRAVKAEPESADYLHQLGLAYRRAAARAAATKRKGVHDQYMAEARRHLTRASELEDSATLQFDLGVLFRRLSKPYKAISHYESAVALEPKLAAAWWDLAAMYDKTKQFDLAIGAYERYIALEGRRADAKIARERIEALRKQPKPDKGKRR